MEYKKLIDKMKIFTFIFIFLISFDEIKIRKTIYYKCYIFLATTTTSVFGHVYIFQRRAGLPQTPHFPK